MKKTFYFVRSTANGPEFYSGEAMKNELGKSVIWDFREAIDFWGETLFSVSGWDKRLFENETDAIKHYKNETLAAHAWHKTHADYLMMNLKKLEEKSES